jgi:hypothetical protein
VAASDIAVDLALIEVNSRLMALHHDISKWVWRRVNVSIAEEEFV